MITYYTKEGRFKIDHYDGVPFSKLHRINGPSLIYKNGNKYWYVNGKQHRLDGPAVILNSGDKVWYKNGEIHREDGPAVIWYDGDEEWWQHGKKHRLDGPAVVHLYGNKGYWINDKELNTKEIENWIKNNNINLKRKEHQVLFVLRFG